MGIVDWNVDKGNSSENGGKQVEYLYLNGGKTYTVRPLKKPIEYAQYFYKHANEKKSRFAFIPLSNIDDCSVRAKHPTELPNKAVKRYAVLIIDRNDSNKIKVMPFPYSVREQIGALIQEHGIDDPGDKDGADFKIKVTGSGQYNTKYFVMFDGCTSLTKEELILYNECKDIVDLQKIYKPHTPEEVEKRLFGKFDSQFFSDPILSSGETSFDLNDDIPF